ncbi:MAG: hypothetical protein ABI729_08040 [Chitinophagales bacterium]
MTTENKPIKCASRDFKSSPFYLIQSNGPHKRFVASFQDAKKIKLFLSTFIDSSAAQLQIKILDFDDHENPLVFDGQSTKAKLIDALDKYEELVFHDGYHDLMIRRPETGDYIAFDEHGLIFIYTQDNYSDTLNKLGLAYKANEKLIYQFDHWHYRPANGKQDLKNLITELELE